MAGEQYDVSIEREPFGRMPEGHPVERYTLRNEHIRVDVTTYGARVTGMWAPDRNGVEAQVVLGMETLAEYLADTSFQGAIAGRYANRIAGGKFTLGGKPFQVPANDGENALHGGPVGFDRKLWTAHEIQGGISLTLESPNGDQGFPGTLRLQVRYTLEGPTLKIAYDATTDRDTVVNVTNHSYFNLAGEGVGNILDHVLELPAESYTPVDAKLIPTGEIAPVTGTPFDFRKPVRIGERIDLADEQLERAGGYDHNWVLGEADTAGMRLAARMHEPHSARTLTVRTTEPGVQFYSGNMLTGELLGVRGAYYEARTAFCLETQHFPDSPNHGQFPTTTLKAGGSFLSHTTYTFSVEEHPWQS